MVRVRSVSNNTKKCCLLSVVVSESGHIHIMSYSVNPKQTEGRFVGMGVGPVENSVYGAAFAVFFESERSVLFENFALFDTTYNIRLPR
jgi:hypothetical protein